MNTILVLLIYLPVLYSSLSPWINKTNGEETADRLNRRDVGALGNFEGGSRHRRPLLLVHGLSGWGVYYNTSRKDFLKLGYLGDEVYDVTYGDGNSTLLHTKRMKCEYVKRVRDMIRTVRRRKRSQVDIIAYSMGSPIARKAILGGKCVDTEEHLGYPLTGLVHTFLSVAGANYGLEACWLTELAICNSINGLSCGSKFLKDIKSRRHYEGELVLVIYSTDDNLVGYKGCGGKILSDIDGSDYTVAKEGLNHKQVIDDTVREQLEMISKRNRRLAYSR